VSHCYVAYHHNAGFDDDHIVVKIGHSKNPSSRFKELVAMSWIGPKWIEVTTRNTDVHGSEIERFMHEFLKSHRVHHEWFHVPREDLARAKSAVWQKYGESFGFHDISDEDWEQAA